MKFKLILLCAFFCAAAVYAADLDAKFVKAIRIVETGQRTGIIIGKKGERGYYQIRKQCWQESGVAGRFTDCDNPGYSVKVMTAYLNKVAPKAVKEKNYQILARRWNGGPDGEKKKATINYWNRIRNTMTDLENKKVAKKI